VIETAKGMEDIWWILVEQDYSTIMSPGNQSVFSAFKIGDFLKNSGVLQLTKIGALRVEK